MATEERRIPLRRRFQRLIYGPRIFSAPWWRSRTVASRESKHLCTVLDAYQWREPRVGPIRIASKNRAADRVPAAPWRRTQC